MKYNRKLTANYYNGCSDKIARAIDTMAGLIPDTLQEIPRYEWRGSNRMISSRNNDAYEVLQKKLSQSAKERRKQEEIDWMNNSCKQES